jgi:transcriptional regulator with XRE-family HTH domain
MRSGTTRLDAGMSLERVATIVGVSRGTLTMYEANPQRVGERLRRLISAFYRDLSHALRNARNRAKE